MNATQILDATTQSAQFSLGKCRSKHIIAHPCTTRNLFYASTCSLQGPNKTHLIEFKEDENKIYNLDSYENEGIIRQVVPDSHNEERFYTIYSTFDKSGIEKTGFNLKGSSVKGSGEDITSVQQPIFSQNFDTYIHSLVNRLKDQNKLYFGETNHLNVFDIQQQQVSRKLNEGESGSNLCDVDPHHNDYVASAQNNGSILIHDIRTQKAEYVIKNAHRLRIHDLDFNPLKLYYFQSVGEDNTIKFWELRKPNLPMKVIDKLNNIPLSCKYNKVHDQLLITAFNDGTLGLYRVMSMSSYPDQTAQKEPDGLIKTYDQHENTVYSVSWSNLSSWIFASISYQGDIVVNMVPSSIKHRILY
ncbi:hypothetical protein ABPG74_017939 [Tetrahymena malaccensis]